MKKLFGLSFGLLILLTITFFAHANMNGGYGNTGITSDMNNNGAFGNTGITGGSMSNNGGFGMMNGMAGTPVIGKDGSAYLVKYEPGTNTTTLSSNSFQSTLIEITPGGQVTKVTLNGIVSQPVITGDGNSLIATASLPDMSQYTMLQNNNTSATSVSTLYTISLPFSQTPTPVAVSLDGSFASVPVIVDSTQQIYVTTSDHGDFMMGRGMFDGMFGNNFTFQSGNSYLYILNFDGTVASKVQF